ncbi:hypothetical protein H0H92_004792 [Tricholoma furcatifolium]|nr:hypothetical protein H0H92_004792 [Tricholoma furcatifolium]
MLPSPSSSPPQILHERTNIFHTPVQTKLPFALPTPPTTKHEERVAATAKKRKLSFSESISKSDGSILKLDEDEDVEMDDLSTVRPRTRRYTSFYMGMRAVMGLPGHRREDPSTRAILQSFVSSNKSDVYKCQSTDVNAYLTPPYACSYTHGAKNGGIPLLAIATEQGSVHFVNTSRRKDWDPEPPRTTLQIHHNGIFDAKWNADDKLLATCSGDQSAHISCPVTERVIHTLRGHASTVKCVAWDPINPHLLSTGARDGGICLWDLRVAGSNDEDGPTVLSPVNFIPGAHEDSTSRARRRSKKIPAPRSVTSLLYPEVGSYGLISGGSFDGIIKHWDLRQPVKPRKSSKLKPPNCLFSSSEDPTTLYGSRSRGIVRLIAGMGPTAGLVFALGADSRVHVYELFSLKPMSLSYGHENMQTNSFYVGMSLSPCGRWLATGSGASGNDTRGGAFLFDVSNAARFGNPVHSRQGIQLKGQQGEVGAVDWSNNSLASCADDGTVRVWRPDLDVYHECIGNPEESRWDWSWHA